VCGKVMRKTFQSFLLLAGLTVAPGLALSSPSVPADVAIFTTLTFDVAPGVASFAFQSNGEVTQLSRITDAASPGRIAIGPDGVYVAQRSDSLSAVTVFAPDKSGNAKLVTTIAGPQTRLASRPQLRSTRAGRSMLRTMQIEV
jgi:hypothetical protein